MLTIFRLYRCGDIIRVIILSEMFMAFLIIIKMKSWNSIIRERADCG